MKWHPLAGSFRIGDSSPVPLEEDSLACPSCHMYSPPIPTCPSQ